MGKARLEERDAGVALLTLADPDKRNALGPEMAAEIAAVVERLAADDDVRSLVVTGAGTAFCAGADLPALFGDPDRAITDLHDELTRYYATFLAIRELPFPTIAAVQGPAVGAGLNLAMACDVRIAGPRAAFGATFARIGLHPGGGATWFLVQALGPSRALRTLLLGDTIGAEQAVAWGLADGPEDDPVAGALALAGRFAAVDPVLARHIGRSVSIAARTGDLGAVLAYETWAQAASASSPAVQAWVDRFRAR